ncbi:MAG: hypothetical protein DRR06_01200 [Gammaproteobacteria bacterium]|nr:MAG: hypothetical protein DRR06_01200 [Gammaproteobacteria bacterium]RLA54280.1 MAG: hypothetical protein DRR42_02325 [Gammaproteobacteria bacterium]
MNEISINAEDAGSAKLVYILYLVSVVFGVTSIIGVIMAYINKDEAPEWLQSHYQFQIRTFWIGLLYGTIGMILTVVLIGWIVLMFALVWLVIRCIKGLQTLGRKEAHPDPASWMF